MSTASHGCCGVRAPLRTCEHPLPSVAAAVAGVLPDADYPKFWIGSMLGSISERLHRFFGHHSYLALATASIGPLLWWLADRLAALMAVFVGYERTLAYVWIDGEGDGSYEHLFNEGLLRLGYARTTSFAHTYSRRFSALEDEAREAGFGL